MKETKIFIATGLSCAGKDEFCRYLEKEYGYHNIVSSTNRPIRPQETEGRDYYFVTKEEFEKGIENDEFVEHRKYNTLVEGNPSVWYYGPLRSEIKDYSNNCTALDIRGVRAFKEQYGDRCIVVNLWSHPWISEELCKKRGDYDPTEWERRYRDDCKLYSKKNMKGLVDYNLFNAGDGLGKFHLEIDTLMEEISGSL